MLLFATISMAEVTTAPWRMLNGEKMVVLLFVFRVLSSLPLSLFPHGLAVTLLSFFAMFVEICADYLSPVSAFKTRPGASSGIMLGAVTLPTVTLSKLIQLSRALSSQNIERGEIEHLTMRYWSTSICCFGVLIFLCLVMRNTPKNKHTNCSSSAWVVGFSLSSVLLYVALCCVSLVSISYSGLNIGLKWLWLFAHGIAAVRLIQYLLNTFPACASIGEALLVTSGLVIYFGDMLACTIAKVVGFFISRDVVSVQYGIRRTEIDIIIQGLLLGLLILPVVFKFVLHLWKYLGQNHSKEMQCEEMGRSLIFFSSLGVIMIVAAPSWMNFVQDFNAHPFLWVLNFIISEPLKRLSLTMYWLALICASVLRFYHISKRSKIERILLRKYYHLLAVSMFLPALIYQPEFLDLAFGVALASFLALEIIRVWRIWPFGKPVHEFMNAFTDHRDSDLLIVSHFSLLLGCALPIWMSSGFNDRPLGPFAGILSLGIGDTMASVVGYKYGVLRWSKSGKKTIEGTAAGITSVLASCFIILPLLASTGYIFCQHWFSLVVAVTTSGLLEAYTAQLDNAFLPLVFYSLLCL